MKDEVFFLTRSDLAKRWGCSVRKIDRLRNFGDLPWVDLTAKKGKKPVVRFSMQQVIDFENNCRINPKKNQENQK